MGGGRGDYESLSDRVGYDMSNVGWTTVPLGNVADINMGQSPPSSTVNEDGLGMPFIQGNAEFGPRSPQPVKYCSKPQKEARLGDLLLSVRAPVGALNLADQPLCIGRGLSAITATGVESAFLWHALRREVLGLTRVAQGSTFSAVNKADLRTLEIPLPPVGEQRKIAAILSSVDDAIEKTQAVIDQVQVVKRGLMQELLTRGLPGRHTRFKQTEIGEIPAEWEVVELASVATVERGKFAHRPRNEPRFYGGSYPFIQTGDVAACDGLISTYSQTLNEEGLAISKLFPSGTIAITIAANIGSTGIATLDVAFPDSLVGIQAGPRIDTRFLELVLRTRKGDLEKFAPESAQKNINLNTLKPLRVPLPAMTEQTQIAQSVWSTIKREKNTRQHCDGLNQLKSALMSVLLTGELRVTPDSEAA